MAEDGEVALDGASAKLPGHAVRLTAEDEKLWQRSAASRRHQRFHPPQVGDISGLLGVPEADVRRVAKLLGRLGGLDEVAHDLFFLRGTVAEMVRIAADIAASSEAGEFTAAQFRDRVDNGRKVAIQILSSSIVTVLLCVAAISDA